MWKFEAITQGFSGPGLGSGVQPVTCIEDKGGSAPPPGFWQRDAAMRGRQQSGEADGGDEAAA